MPSPAKPPVPLRTEDVLLSDTLVGEEGRARHNPEQLRLLSSDMNRLGQFQNIGLIEGKPFRVAFGAGRCEAAKLGGWKTIRASVYPATASVTALPIAENIHRADVPAYWKFRKVAQLAEENPYWSQQAIA